MDPVIQVSVSYALAAMWLFGAVSKAKNFRAFRTTVAEYRVLPGILALPAATMVVGLEFGFGMALFVPLGRPPALAGSSGLLLLYAGMIGVNLLRGRRHIDCGCMGPGYRQSLSEWLVGRNLVLAAAALAAMLPVESRGLLWVDAVSIGATVGILAVFYMTVNRLIANAPRLTSLGN